MRCRDSQRQLIDTDGYPSGIIDSADIAWPDGIGVTEGDDNVRGIGKHVPRNNTFDLEVAIKQKTSDLYTVYMND